MSRPPRKRYGQHFLIDECVIDDIISLVGPRTGERIVEIGPGKGALTRPLLESGVELDVVEIDRDLAGQLATDFADNPGLRIHVADALKFEFGLLARPGGGLRLVGNLPYNISTPLLLKLLESGGSISSMVFMLQKEIVDRLVADPGTREYGRLTVVVRYLCDVEAHFDVTPDCFDPPPRVLSSIVSLRPRPIQSVPVKLDWFSEIVRRAFSGRRKTLKNTLGRSLGPDVLERCGVDAALRPEQLSVQDYARLAAATDRRTA